VAESLLVAGIVCIVASIVGGGVKLLGAEMPVLNSFARQAMLFAVGGAFLFASFWTTQTKLSPPVNATAGAPATVTGPPVGQPVATAPSAAVTAAPGPSSQPATHAAGCADAEALSCLPTSSGPVSFENPSAANLAAAANIRDGLSTTVAQARAASAGASGKASRLCGIVASNDSSPLGKHNAAVRLSDLGAGDGQATDACLKSASSFL